MKSFIKISAAAMLVLSMLVSCSTLAPNADGFEDSSSKATSIATESTFAVGDYGVSFTFDGDWAKTDSENFDLQLSSKKYGAYFSVFVYYRVDLSNGKTVEDMFNEQNEDIFSNRQNVSTVSETETKTVGTKSIFAKTTSAENNGNKNYYRTYMIDDPESKIIVWVLLNTIPSDMEKHQGYFDSIVNNVTIE